MPTRYLTDIPIYSFLALGKEMVFGGNRCLLSYYPQRFHMHHSGHIIQDDFCLTLLPMEGDIYEVGAELCREDRLDQKFKRIRPDRTHMGVMIQYMSDTSLCLDTKYLVNKGLCVARCDSKNPAQRFQFDYNFVKV